MTWSLYIDGELYKITNNHEQALKMRRKLEFTGYVLINKIEESYHQYVWEFRLA